MERSDPPRPPASDPAAAKPEAEKPAAAPDAPAGTSLSETGTAAQRPRMLPASASPHAPEEAIERADFEMLERETTLRVDPIPDPSPPEWAGPQSSSSPAFEPRPFEVPAPHEAPIPEAPAAVEPAPAPASAPAAAATEPADFAAPLAPDWAPTLRAPPAFEHPAAADLAPPAAAPRAASSQRDWRDIARRAASVAVIVFAGWLAAVLFLIVVYRFVNPPFSMLMAQRWITGTSITKAWAPIDGISPNLSRAVIVSEDGRFCQHWGVDFVEALNAIRRTSSGYPRGASTITMQVAKNLFLVPTKSYLRKMIEIPLTFAIELFWPKRRILEVYLNIVEWGPGIFGAEAAARAHFGRSAATLSTRQAAQLAAVLPNPIVRDAGDPGPRTARKASIIQARAARAPEASSCIGRPRR